MSGAQPKAGSKRASNAGQLPPPDGVHANKNKLNKKRAAGALRSKGNRDSAALGHTLKTFFNAAKRQRVGQELRDTDAASHRLALPSVTVQQQQQHIVSPSEEQREGVRNATDSDAEGDGGNGGDGGEAEGDSSAAGGELSAHDRDSSALAHDTADEGQSLQHLSSQHVQQPSQHVGQSRSISGSTAKKSGAATNAGGDGGESARLREENTKLQRQLRDALGHFQPGNLFARALLQDLNQSLTKNGAMTKTARSDRRRAFERIQKEFIASKELLRTTAKALRRLRVEYAWYTRQVGKDEKATDEKAWRTFDENRKKLEEEHKLKALKKKLREEREENKLAASQPIFDDADDAALLDTYSSEPTPVSSFDEDLGHGARSSDAAHSFGAAAATLAHHPRFIDDEAEEQ